MRVLSKAPIEWRWALLDRHRSQWFPTATVYAEKAGDWARALALMAEDLR
ncbi:MAG: hypothetical protein AAF384_19815 [Pseudomonadota bacterium]